MFLTRLKEQLTNLTPIQWLFGLGLFYVIGLINGFLFLKYL